MERPFPNPTDKKMGDPLKAPVPVGASPRISMKGKGRWILVSFFFLFVVSLIFLPTKKYHGRETVFNIVSKGGSSVSKETIDRWIGPDVASTIGSGEAISSWVSRHPWVSDAALLRHPWGGGTVIVTIQEPMAILRPPTVFVPGQLSFPWGSPRVLPYLLKSGKVVTGRSAANVQELPEVILSESLTFGSGKKLVKAISLEKDCRGSGAPKGDVFVFLGKHEIRMLPEHASYYLVLPERNGCASYKMLARFLFSHPPDAGGRLSVGLGGIVLGIDLRFSKMILLRQDLPKKQPVGKRSKNQKL